MFKHISQSPFHGKENLKTFKKFEEHLIWENQHNLLIYTAVCFPSQRHFGECGIYLPFSPELSVIVV